MSAAVRWCWTALHTLSLLPFHEWFRRFAEYSWSTRGCCPARRAPLEPGGQTCRANRRFAEARAQKQFSFRGCPQSRLRSAGFTREAVWSPAGMSSKMALSGSRSDETGSERWNTSRLDSPSSRLPMSWTLSNPVQRLPPARSGSTSRANKCGPATRRGSTRRLATPRSIA